MAKPSLDTSFLNMVYNRYVLTNIGDYYGLLYWLDTGSPHYSFDSYILVIACIGVMGDLSINLMRRMSYERQNSC